MLVSQGKDLILNFQQFYFFTAIHCIAQVSIKLSALVACCFKMCAAFFFKHRIQCFISENLVFGSRLKSTVDPERKPLQISSSKVERKI